MPADSLQCSQRSRRWDSVALSISPDGKRFAVLGSPNEPVRSYAKTDLWMLDNAPNAQPKDLTANMDIEFGGGGIGGDQAPPRGGGGGGIILVKGR